jgi:hypothetical protein
MDAQVKVSAPAAPRVRLCVGVTGHRESHPLVAANKARIEAVLSSLFDLVGVAVEETQPPFGEAFAPVRLHSMLADGADQWCADHALARGWELVAPLPVGRELNRAVNALPETAADARALLAGETPGQTDVGRRAADIERFYAAAHLFELADDDEQVRAAFLAMHDAPSASALADAFKADASLRVAQAARVVIEQSDFLIGLWDGVRTSLVGGTGHTIAAALDLGANVIWIDPAEPEAWRLLTAPEALAAPRASPPNPAREEQIKRMVRGALRSEDAGHGQHGHATAEGQGHSALDAQHWRAQSNPLWQAYRRIEALFGGDKGRNPWRSLRATYETPEGFPGGGGAGVLRAADALPGRDEAFVGGIKTGVMGRFAWADGLSSHLSDTYRGGMIINFVLSACAIIGGVAYLPLTGGELKWPFALFELALLSAILVVTFLGQKRRWHGRWFETRRVAEYLRHAPLLLVLGAARAPGRWPRGAVTSWPEHYARHAVREVGLPRAVVTPAYLRQALTGLLVPHVIAQRDYHHAKAKRLAHVHHSLDRLSERMFQFAVGAVLVYLATFGLAEANLLKDKTAVTLGKVFTFLGVALPTLGGALAGIRYFGDFERFAAISEITAGKLSAIHDRIALLLQAPDEAMDYDKVAELVRAADDIVVSEIENWQAVFAGKHITVPV